MFSVNIIYHIGAVVFSFLNIVLTFSFMNVPEGMDTPGFKIGNALTGVFLSLIVVLISLIWKKNREYKRAVMIYCIAIFILTIFKVIQTAAGGA